MLPDDEHSARKEAKLAEAKVAPHQEGAWHPLGTQCDGQLLRGTQFDAGTAGGIQMGLAAMRYNRGWLNGHASSYLDIHTTAGAKKVSQSLRILGS